MIKKKEKEYYILKKIMNLVIILFMKEILKMIKKKDLEQYILKIKIYLKVIGKKIK